MITSSIIYASAVAAAIHNPISAKDIDRVAAMVGDSTVAASVEIVVDPQGKMQSCVILKAWGSVEAARMLCEFEGSGGWVPARDKDGQPAWSVIRQILQFGARGVLDREAEKLAKAPDLEIFVERLPSPGARPLNVKIAMQVDASGQVVACEPFRTESNLIAYARAACVKASNGLVPAPQSKFDSYVIAYRVRFLVRNEE